MKEKQREQIKKEWLEADFLSGVPYDINAIKEAIAKWWMDKLDEILKEKKEKIKRELYFTASPEGDWGQGYNKGLSEAIKIINDE